ncbi:hypothetical protein E2K93_02130 [Thalassotalea sp. HSM 43]|uniref:spondin domain-containing protein n=1 Tax=Thalassotalea sp. HSM 43 TaxID=2552945 RepID=UPI00108030B3|nr:spondin domain-containing protein [Thalassotalea sp. HSM 43]QBY03239.1 hypothetical protein E2K93_02130 [Thalassotalea sp. HSM 43]
MNFKINKLAALAISSGLLLTACGGDSGDDSVSAVSTNIPNFSYQVDVVNLTYAQPMSPVAVVLHDEGQLWTLGESASMALENLAESGDGAMIMDLDVVSVSAAGEGMLMPGMNQQITITTSALLPQKISLATMLVNTNDAFAGVNGLMIADLEVGESISLVSGSYDAGTEANSETAASIPGPAGGGEGYNAIRDDVDFVAMHPGVVTMDDGLMASALTFDHRFDNPTLRVTITRTE